MKKCTDKIKLLRDSFQTFARLVILLKKAEFWNL